MTTFGIAFYQSNLSTASFQKAVRSFVQYIFSSVCQFLQMKNCALMKNFERFNIFPGSYISSDSFELKEAENACLDLGKGSESKKENSKL